MRTSLLNLECYARLLIRIDNKIIMLQPEL